MTPCLPGYGFRGPDIASSSAFPEVAWRRISRARCQHAAAAVNCDGVELRRWSNSPVGDGLNFVADNQQLTRENLAASAIPDPDVPQEIRAGLWRVRRSGGLGGGGEGRQAHSKDHQFGAQAQHASHGTLLEIRRRRAPQAAPGGASTRSQWAPTIRIRNVPGTGGGCSPG